MPRPYLRNFSAEAAARPVLLEVVRKAGCALAAVVFRSIGAMMSP